MTVKQILDAVYRLFDILNPSAVEYDAGMTAINLFLQELAATQQGVIRLIPESFNTVASTASYTIGTGQTWNTSRPIAIQGAFIRVGTDDYPVSVYNSMLEYAAVPLKSLEGRPDRLFYEPASSTGTIFPWPVPDAVYALHIYSQKPFTAYTNIADALGLSPEYEPMLKWNLAMEMADELGKEPTASMIMRSKATMRTLKHLHAHPVPQLRTDPFGGGLDYDINGDIYR